MNTTWDRTEHEKMKAVIFRAAAKSGNPVSAASLMFEALDRAWDAPSARAGLVDNFTGRLLDQLLRVVGEPPSTDSEQRI